jgi:glutamate dehydrogenase (NADP+)
LQRIKNVERGRISELAEVMDGIEFHKGKKSWELPGDVDVAMPCATQNELGKEDVEKLIKQGLKIVAEGANMPTTPEAYQVIQENDIAFAPGKASNAGGVATSGLEMSQNSLRMSWTSVEVDQKLHAIMKDIHAACVEYGTENGKVDYVKGANIAGFVKVADSMIDQGLV